jgi:hypothetical protein
MVYVGYTAKYAFSLLQSKFKQNWDKGIALGVRALLGASICLRCE